MARQSFLTLQAPQRRFPRGLKTGLMVLAFTGYSTLLGGYCSYNAKEHPQSFSAEAGHYVVKNVTTGFSAWRKERAERLQKEELEQKRKESLDEIVEDRKDEDPPIDTESVPSYRLDSDAPFGQKNYVPESPFGKYQNE
jgi:hypothetical protein